jgi:hypothetical protein
MGHDIFMVNGLFIKAIFRHKEAFNFLAVMAFVRAKHERTS